MKIIGTLPINSLVFLTGKLALYAALFSMILQASGWNLRMIYIPPALLGLAVFSTLFGIALILAGILYLGDSTSVGLPSEQTLLKTGGLYKHSRNPIYFGFCLMTASAITYTLNPLVLVLGAYGVIVHHRIILAEEKFLKERFGRL